MKRVILRRPPALHCNALHAQQGQALVLGMLLAGIAALALVRYFAVGQVVGAKARQLHALDAAAYSGALVQARALNMLALTNRAQAGHQLAMAHLVTLGSWAGLGGTEARQLATGNPPAYLIAMMFGPEHGQAYVSAAGASGLDELARTGNRLARAYALHDETVRRVLRSIQEEVVSSLPGVRYSAMQEVLAANFPESREPFELRVLDDTWAGHVTLSAGASLRPFVQHLAGFYDFLGRRDHTASNPWVVDARCPMLRHELRRRGNTTLDAAGRWQSADTQSFHALRSNRWIGCYRREYPMGWAWVPSAAGQSFEGPYVSDPPENFSSQDFWRWVASATDWDLVDGDANPLANSRAAAARQRWSGGGIPAFHDVSPGRELSTLRFGVELRHPGPESLTIRTRAAAETYFQRPRERQDGRREPGNLFHPYWQARLAPVSPGEAAP